MLAPEPLIYWFTSRQLSGFLFTAVLVLLFFFTANVQIGESSNEDKIASWILVKTLCVKVLLVGPQ